MPFWKKSEDPWDAAPAKERARREPAENPLDTLKGWNQERRARAAARQAELEAQPGEKCPWCGKDMERGYLLGGRDRITWTPGFLTTKAAWLGPDRETRARRMQVDDEGAALTTYKTAWYCRDCRKMVIDAAGMREVNTGCTWPEDDSPYAQELHQYFEESKQGGEDGEETS